MAFARINKIYLNSDRWTKRKAPKPQVIGLTWLTYFLVQWSPSKVLNNLSRLLQRCAQNLDTWFSVMGCLLVLATLPCIPTFTYYTNTHGSDTDHIFWDVRRRMILYVGGLTFYAHVDMSRFIHRKMLWGGGNPSSRSQAAMHLMPALSRRQLGRSNIGPHGRCPRWILGWMGWKWRGKRYGRGYLVEQIVYTFQTVFSMTTFDCETRRSIPNATAIRPPSNRPSWVGVSVGAMFDAKGVEVSP